MKLFSCLFSVIVLSMGLVGCKGGGSSDKIDPKVQQQELIDQFIVEYNKLWYFEDEDGVQLVKADTEQGEGWFVVYNTVYDEYGAIYIGPYEGLGEGMGRDFYNGESGADLYNFLYNSGPGIVEVLVTPNEDGTYTDAFGMGFVFEKASSTAYDEELEAAYADALKIRKSVNYLVSEYGLPESSAENFSKLIFRMSAADKRSLTDADYDNFTTELLGSKGAAERYQKAVKNYLTTGDKSDLNKELALTGQHHGVGAEQVSKILERHFFGK